MSGIHTSTVRPAHAYTRSDTPWIMDVRDNVCGRLVRLISGGGMRTFGRTVAQEAVRLRQRRFLTWSAVVGVLWLVFLVF